MRGLVAIDIRGLAVTIAWPYAGYHAIFYVCPEQAIVGIIGSAQEMEGRIIMELVAVNFFPVSIRIVI